MSRRDRTWRIGELAREAGLTVRTLHHYDQLGLLSPLSRTEGGHRCYTSGDVRRLHRIVALRSLGISVEERGREYRTMAGFPEDSRGHTPIPGGLHG
jgi:MerR family transcriptional regulator, thiopeptide resistance regulator